MTDIKALYAEQWYCRLRGNRVVSPRMFSLFAAWADLEKRNIEINLIYTGSSTSSKLFFLDPLLPQEET
jgi:hypothetical protein